MSSIYSNLARQFPIENYTGMDCFFIAYIYKYDCIMIRTIKSRRDEEHIAIFKDVCAKLCAKGHHSKHHVLDSKCSKAVKNYTTPESTDMKLAKPDNNCANAIKPVIAEP